MIGRGTRAAALLLLCFVAAAASAQPARESSQQPPVRRIYVPADKLDPEARGLLPLSRAEFERRMSDFATTVVPNSAPPSATITDSVYRATLRGDHFVAGTADLNIQRRTPAATDRLPDWLNLGPCGLALGNPTWQEDETQETKSAASSVAVFGQDEKQQLLLAVPRDGKLQLPWSLRGRRDERGQLKFVFDLPPALRRRMELRIPSSWRLTSDNAVLRETPDDESGSKATDSESLWHVDVATNEQIRLVVEPRLGEEQAKPLVLVRETGSYVFTPGQMDLELSLELDISGSPIRQIRVRHDPRLQWTVVRWGEQLLTWKAEKPASGEPIAVIQLPEPLIGSSRLIQLTAVADWSPSPQKWPLPRVTVENAIWQEGRVNVASPRWLQLDAAAGSGARLSATTLTSESQGMDLLQFQLERNTAPIEVQTAVGNLAIDATSLLTLQVEPKQVVANFVAELSTTGAQQFSVDCEIPRTWVIDSIETKPAEVLEDRVIRSRGNVQVATLFLKQPLRANRSLRLQVRLRHVRVSGAESWGDEMLHPVHLVNTEVQRYVALQLGDASFEPRLLSADGLEFILPADLPNKVRALSELPIGNWLVRLKEASRQPRFSLAPGSPSYAADSQLRLQFSDEHVDYSLQVRCEPESSAVSNVLVQLRPPPTSEPQWRLANDDRRLVAERLETMAAASDMPGTALYRIELPRARDTTFSIVAQWSDSIAVPTFSPLVEIPEANSHAAHLEIAGPLASSLSWQATRMRPLPIPATAEDVRASYRYQSGQDARLVITPLAKANRPVGGWISRCDVDTEFSPTGAGRHEARFVVVGKNVEVLEIRLAENARLARAAVNGKEVLAFSRSNDARWLSIPLRSSETTSQPQNPLVRVEYTSPPNKEPSWLITHWSAPLPETRLPILQSLWQVHLPSSWQPWPQPASSADSQRTGSNPSLFSATFLALLQPAFSNSPLIRDLPTSAQVQLTVYSPVWFGLIAIVLGMVAAAVALRCRSWSPFKLLGAALALLAVSLLLTEPWSSFIQAILAGWLTGCALQVFGRPITIVSQSANPMSTAFAIQPISRIAMILVALGLCTTLAGDQLAPQYSANAAENDAAPAKAWRVVIPVDDDRQPTEYVYISPELYAALFRAKARSSDQPAWLIRTAQYESRWSSGPAETPVQLQGLVARFEVENFAERSVVRLPFLHQQVRLSDQGVKIEGEPAAANWNSTNDALQVEVNGIGRKRLEIGLALVTPVKDGAAGASLRIPVVANSIVQIPTLPAAENIVITSSQGAELPSATADRQIGLGPTEQLTVHWSRAALEPAPVIEAEQLLLWRLRPSSLVVEGKWQFRPLSGRLREVVLRTDPRYRLLSTGNGASIVRQWTEEGETNLHHFVLDRSTTNEVNLTASFLLVGSTGIGSVVPPPIEPVADRLSRDWQAAWTAPGLQWKGKAGTLPTAEFLQAWGDASLSPVQAFRSTADAPRPTLAVSAVQNRLQADEKIDWSLAPDQSSVRFHLQGTQFATTVNQLRFQLPPQLIVRRVAVSQNETDVAIRWSRHADGLLSILLDEVRAEPWVLEIDAHRPHQPGKPVNLPVLQTAEIDIPSYECTIRRRGGATISLGKLIGWKETPEAEREEPLATDQVFARLNWTSSRPGSIPQQIPVTIETANTAYSGELLTRVLSLDDDWRLEVIANLQPVAGSLDELQFSIPRDWEGPFEFDPPAKYRLESLPGQSRNLLRVQLVQPTREKLLLRITAPLAVEQELIRLPLVEIINSQTELQRFVALPRSGDNSPLQWQTTGLQLRSELPAELSNPAAGPEIVYEAIIDRYRATARPERIRAEHPKIVLAEHQVSWQADRRIVGQTDLMVLPNGAKSLLIQPPEAHELVAAIVNDVPGQLRREPGISGAATIELHSDTWPQWVQIIYRGRLTVSDSALDRLEFSAPRISGAPVEQTRWQITGPVALQLPAERISAGTTATDDALANLKALERMAQGTAEAPAGNHAASAGTWLALWRKRWDYEMAAVRKIPPSSPLAPLVAADLQSLASKVADQLNAPLVEPPSGATAPSKSPFTLDAVQPVSIDRPLFELHYGASGDVATLTVMRAATPRHSSVPWQVLLACGLLILAAAITQISRSSGLRDWVIAYPHLVLAVLGVVALVIPGYLWVGVLLLACSLLVTLHSPWHSRA